MCISARWPPQAADKTSKEHTPLTKLWAKATQWINKHLMNSIVWHVNQDSARENGWGILQLKVLEVWEKLL